MYKLLFVFHIKIRAIFWTVGQMLFQIIGLDFITASEIAVGAVGGWYPQICRSRVEDDGKVLRRRTQSDGPEILGLHIETHK